MNAKEKTDKKKEVQAKTKMSQGKEKFRKKKYKNKSTKIKLLCIDKTSIKQATSPTFGNDHKQKPNKQRK